MLEYHLIMNVFQGVLGICHRSHEFTSQEGYSIKVSNEA
jgi:hypothetical protein